MRRIVSRVTIVVVAVLGASLSLAPPASADTEWISWKVTGNGYCVVHTLRPLSPLPATSGELLRWSASTSLCGDAPVSGLRLKASVVFPYECRFHHPGEETSRYYTGGQVAETYDEPRSTGAATYFEDGDGTVQPEGSIGTIVGGRPEAAAVTCWNQPGWEFKLRSYVVAPDTGAWAEVGSSTYPLQIMRHPNFDLERHAAIVSDEHVVSRDASYCGDINFRLYDTDETLVVGDLFEWASVMRLCTTEALIYGERDLVTFDPPSDCPAPRWMYPRGGGQGGWYPAGHSAGGGSVQYGDPAAAFELPPDIEHSGGRGASVVPNCPGTWTVKLRFSIDDIDDRCECLWHLVGRSRVDVVVAPPADMS